MSTHPPLFIFIFFTEIVYATSRQTEFESSLANLTDRVIEGHFAIFGCVTYVLDEGVEMTPTQLLPVFITFLPVEKKILTESFEQNCGGYVVRVCKKSEVAKLLIEAKHGAIGSRYNKQRYLFLPMNETDDDLELLDDSNMFFLPNLILAVPKGGALSLVTHTVLDHHSHDLLGVAHEVLDEWTPGNKGFKFGRDLYPDKVSDVKGRKFVFALVHYTPFGLVIKEGNKTVFDGFETRIAAQFVKSVNGTWEGLDHPVEMWGELFPNGSSTGIVGSVLSNKADFGFGAFYQWYCEDSDCSYPFYQSAVTCLVPRPQMVSGWLTIILPFQTDTWVTLILVYLISSTFLLFLFLKMLPKKELKIKDALAAATCDSFFANFRLQLEQIPDIPKNKEPLSTYVKISVYYYFFVGAFWKGGISSILTVPRFEKPINDVVDLIERWPKLKWGANTDSWINSIRRSTDPNFVQIVSKFIVIDDEKLKKKTKTGDFGYFVEKLPHGHYGYSDFIEEDSMNYLRLMENNIYTAFGVMIMPKGSPFSEKFDYLVLWLFDTGIVHKIEVQVSIDRINDRLQNMIKYSNVKDQTNVILAIRHIQGPLYIFLGGVSLSFLVFLFEIFLFKLNQNIFADRKK